MKSILPPAALEMFLTDEYDRIYYKVTEEGKLVAGDSALPTPDVVVLPGDPAVMQYGVLGGKSVRIASRYFHLPKTAGKVVLVQVAETLNKRRVLVGHIITAVLIFQFILIVIVALIVWVGVGKGLSPLRVLRRKI